MAADRWEPGDELTAERLNRHLERLRKAEGVPGGAGGAGFAFSGGTGYARTRPHEFWIRLTVVGSAGTYAWREIVPDPATPGGWIDGPRSGTVADDPATEVNGTATLTVGTRAFAWRLPGSRRLNFQMGLCS